MRDLKLLLLFNALSITAMTAFIPVIGPIIRELGLSEWHSGLIITVAGVLWMLMARTWGRISDRRGRKPVLLTAVTGFILSYALLALSLNWMLIQPPGLWLILALLIVFRGLMGVFYAAIPTASAAHIADTTSLERRSAGMAQLGAANGVGMVLGPMFGSLLVPFSLVMPLYVAAALPVFGALLIAVKLPGHKPTDAAPTRPVRLSDPRLRLPLLAMLMAMIGVVTAQMTVGFFAIDQLHLDSQGAARLAGLAMTTVGVVLIVVQIAVSRLPKVAPRQFMLLGALVGATGFALVTQATSAAAIIVCYGLMAAGIGPIFPSVQTLASQSVDADEQGVAAGSVTAVQGFGTVITPMICTLLYEITPATPYALAAVVLALLALIVLMHRPKSLASGNTPVAS